MRSYACEEKDTEITTSSLSLQDLMFYGALAGCPVCSSALALALELKCAGTNYSCKGDYSVCEWSTCPFSTKDPPRIEERIKLPEFVQKSAVSDVIKNCCQAAKKLAPEEGFRIQRQDICRNDDFFIESSFSNTSILEIKDCKMWREKFKFCYWSNLSGCIPC